MTINKVTLIGRLGQDPETRYLPSGEAVCSFSVATSESWKDKNGAKQERTEWHYCTLFGKLAEIAAQYLQKGSQVYLEGKIRSEKYNDKQSIERTAYKIVCHEMKMLGSKSDGAGSQSQYEHSEPVAPPTAKRPNAPAAPVEEIDDDIPY